MARWQLTEPHYLNVPGTFWEQVTTDRRTQRPIRKQYPVPMHLDPRIETDWTQKAENNDMDGKIVVCYAGKGLPTDIVFEGEPTPGMLPMDDEAREISSKYSWTPTNEVNYGVGVDDASHQGKILGGLIKQLAEATVSGQGSSAIPAGFEKFMESMAQMMQQQTMLLAAIMERQQLAEFTAQAQASVEKPPEEAEPLPEAEEPTAEELAEATAEAERKEAESQAKAKAVAAKGLRRA